MLGDTEYTRATLVADAARHLLKQGRPSYRRRRDGRIVCLYRGPDGTSCAIGGVLPDDLYKRSFDKNPINASQLLEKVIGKKAATALGYAADQIQRIHDTWAGANDCDIRYVISDLDYDAPGWREELGEEDTKRFIDMVSKPYQPEAA